MKTILPNSLFFFENQYSHKNHFSGITASMFPITANGQSAALVTVLAISAMMLLKQKVGRCQQTCCGSHCCCSHECSLRYASYAKRNSQGQIAICMVGMDFPPSGFCTRIKKEDPTGAPLRFPLNLWWSSRFIVLIYPTKSLVTYFVRNPILFACCTPVNLYFVYFPSFLSELQKT